MPTEDQMPELDAILRDLKRYRDKDVNKALSRVVEANAREMALTAVNLAPYDNGDLRQSIRPVKTSELSWDVLANATGLAPYAPYQEFGTGNMTIVPPGFEKVAASFKGKGIREVNMKPQPYMYPAFVKQFPIFMEDLRDLLDAAAQKFNRGR